MGSRRRHMISILAFLPMRRDLHGSIPQRVVMGTTRTLFFSVSYSLAQGVEAVIDSLPFSYRLADPPPPIQLP